MPRSQNNNAGNDWFARIADATTIPAEEIKGIVLIACGDDGLEDRSGVDDRTMAYLGQ